MNSTVTVSALETFSSLRPAPAALLARTSPTAAAAGLVKKATPSKSTNGGEAVSKMRLRCLVERVTGVPSVSSSERSNHRLDATVEFDSHISIDSTTSFHCVVEAALRTLGFPDSLIVGARGCIEIRHWKPMTLDSVTDNLNLTVSDVLGNLYEHVTLRIRLCSSMKQWIVADVKQKLLSFLLENSQELLLRSGCPVKKNMVDQIYDETSQLVLSEDFRKEFNDWYQQHMTSHTQPKPARNSHRLNFHKPHNGDVSDHSSLSHAHPLESAEAMINTGLPSEISPLGSSTPHSRSQTYVRTWFDPDSEIPRLQSWLRENKHPSKADLIQYLNTLNSQDYRKNIRRPLDLSNLSYWFKNARARSSQNRHSESNGFNSSLNDSDANYPKGSNSDSNTSSEHKTIFINTDLNSDIHRGQITSLPSGTDGFSHIKSSRENDKMHTDGYQDDSRVPRTSGEVEDGEDKSEDRSDKRKWNSDDCSDIVNKSNGKIQHIEPVDPGLEEEFVRFQSDDEGNDYSNVTTVPDLPNKNAVYVINPLHSSNKVSDVSDNRNAAAQDQVKSVRGDSPRDSVSDVEDDLSNDDASRPNYRMYEPGDDSPPVPLKRQRVETNGNHRNIEHRTYSGNDFHPAGLKHDVNHNKAVHMNGCDTLSQSEATDLSVRSSSRQNPDDMASGEGSSRSSSRQMFKDECEERSRSSSSSPRVHLENGITTHPPQFSLPSPFHMLHQQHALQMAAMSHAMRLMHPVTASMFGNGASPRPNGSGLFLAPPIPFSCASSSALSAVHASPYNDDQDSCGSVNGDSYSQSGSDRKKRSRVFIDPLSEIPKLEQWFLEDSHPSSFVIEQFTDELNRSVYRQRFPRLEPKNVQLWFKNHRAKVKRQRHELSTASSNSDIGAGNERVFEGELDDSVVGRDSVIDNSRLLKESQKASELYRNDQYWQGQSASLKCELNGDC